MTRDRFEEIWRNLHFSDNNDISTEGDKARKVRPIIIKMAQRTKLTKVSMNFL